MADELEVNDKQENVNESEIQPHIEPDSELGLNSEMEPEVLAQKESEQDLSAEIIMGYVTETAMEFETESEAESGSEPEHEPAIVTEAVSEYETEEASNVVSSLESATEASVEPEAGSVTESEDEFKLDFLGEPETESEVDQIPEAEPETEPEKKPKRKTEKKEESRTGFQKFLRIWNGFWKWIFHLRSVGFAIPIAIIAILLAMHNQSNLPEQVGLNIQSTGEYEQMVDREVAVYAPLALTGICLFLMLCSRKVLYPFLISIFSLALPILIWITNTFPN